MKILIVIDMQNDFIDGALGTPEAAAIVPAVAEKIRSQCLRHLIQRVPRYRSRLVTPAHRPGKSSPISPKKSAIPTRPLY